MNAVHTDKAPAALGPYSQAIDTGSFVYVSGQVPVNPETGAIPATIQDQTRQSIENARSILEAAGLGLQNVVKTSVFLSDINEFADMNAVYETYFTAPYPARSCVQVAAIPKGCKVEVEVIAKRETNENP